MSKKSNEWVIHVKKYALENNKSYGCAMSDPMCKLTYKKKSNTQVSNKDISNVEISNVESSKMEISILELNLKQFENLYYAMLITAALLKSYSGRRKKHSVGESPADYYKRYNTLKSKLEKITGKSYPILDTREEFYKKSKKYDQDQKKLEAKNLLEEKYVPDESVESYVFSSKKKKKSGILY